MVTTGDVVPGDLAEVGGKGLFTQELERGLLDGSLDLAVHSLKDLPVRLPEGLAIAAHPERADPRDALVSELAGDLDGLPQGAVRADRSAAAPGADPAPPSRPAGRADPGQRGHPAPQVARERRGRGDPGLRRPRPSRAPRPAAASVSPPEIMLPAPCQGTLALEVRAGGPAEELARALDHPPTARAARAERRIVAAFGGDCTLPLAAWAREDANGAFRLTALLATPDGTFAARGEAVGGDPDELADACVAAMRENGADEVLARLGK